MNIVQHDLMYAGKQEGRQANWMERKSAEWVLCESIKIHFEKTGVRVDR